MFEWLNFHVFAVIGVAFQFGGMMYFAFVFTPMVFRYQEASQASKFLRKVFPFFYRLNAAISIFPALMLFPGDAYYLEVSTLLGVGAAFLFKARILLPIADAARVRNNQVKFKMVHRISVLIYVIQIIAILLVLVRLIVNID